MAATLADASPIAAHRTGSGPPVVLLHCLGVDHRFWDFADGLADEFALLRYDLPGHGATPVPAAPYDIGDLSKQLAGLFRRHTLAHAHARGPRGRPPDTPRAPASPGFPAPATPRCWNGRRRRWS